MDRDEGSGGGPDQAGKGGRATGARAERIGWIDAAKGLGIIAVVVGHVWYRGPVRDLVYAFHMPAFFLLAGYVFRPRPMGDFLRKSLISLALPYAVFLLLLYGADHLIEGAKGFRPWLSGAAGWNKLLVGGSELTGPFTVFWFVPCLFFARLAQNALGRRFPDPRDPAWWLAGSVAAILGVWIGMRTDFSPLGLLPVPIAFLLLWIGQLLSVWEGRWTITARVGICALALLAAVAAYRGWMVPVNMKLGDYGNPWLALPAALLMSIAMFQLARYAPWAGGLGAASLVIMYMHVPIIHYLTPYAPRWIIFPLALFVPYGLHLIFGLNRWTAMLFLGKGMPPPAQNRDRGISRAA